MPREDSGWETHFERTSGLETTSYEETVSFLERLAEETGQGRLICIGETPQKRPIFVFIAGHSEDLSPESTEREGKLVVLVQNAIHGGEVEGKDAWLLLLRQILVSGELRHLLEDLILLLVPVLNVDGHERMSPYNRPNQNGPVRMGWRTTSQSLDLNRDYAKARSPEMRALLSLFNEWLPGFVIDNHTTNGADYQYHVTYSIETHETIDKGLASFAREELIPFVREGVEAAGFLTAPYVQLRTSRIEDGFADPPSLMRYSTGYAAAQNRLSFLVEAHALKPYANRVASTLAMNIAILECLAKNASHLRDLNEAADQNAVLGFGERQEEFPLIVEGSRDTDPFLFKGFESSWEYSPVTGAAVRRYSETAIEFEVPYFAGSAVLETVTPPLAYFVPEELTEVLDVLALNGIEKHREEEGAWRAERYEWDELEFSPRPYEGRQTVSCTIRARQEWVRLSGNGFVVPVAQRRARLLIQLLEPHGPDSLFHWGFFNAFLERKEYAEDFIFEPIARKMLEGNSKLRVEFDQRLEEEDFRQSPSERLDFLYRRSPYFDRREETYPILRLLERHETGRSESARSASE
ncbi:MAG: hypothetical protein DIJKHBIC_04110 [Thermoanaerobaculia bacterium]|nr:hypothetical protein [Thermoanaerobaculia bacterium]